MHCWEGRQEEDVWAVPGSGLRVIWQAILGSQNPRVCPEGENRLQVGVPLVLWTLFPGIRVWIEQCSLEHGTQARGLDFPAPKYFLSQRAD